MPSPFESLSMVALEAWALGRPVLANGRCDVLVGQCQRSNAGLYYMNGREFEAMLEALLDDHDVASRMGENGRAFYEAELRLARHRGQVSEHARSPAKEPPPRSRAGAVPGWFARRRRRLPPAEAVVAALPAGPVRDRAESSSRPS